MNMGSSAVADIAMQIYPNVPQGVAWNGNNIGGSTKRGVGIAMHVGFGNLGGAIAGFRKSSSESIRLMIFPNLIATELNKQITNVTRCSIPGKGQAGVLSWSWYFDRLSQ